MSRTNRIARRFGLLVVIGLLGGGGSAVAQTPGGETREALERDFPGVGILERRERVSAVFGRPMTRGATPREAMEDWVFLYADVFGVEDPELVEARGTEITNGRAAPLHAGGSCRADLNYDGALDFFDFLEFQSMFGAGDMFADFTGDGVLDFLDFVAFENEFAVGCW